VIHRVTIKERPGVLVRIDPPLSIGTVSLSIAILVPRSGVATIDDIASDSLTTAKSVFVYGLKDTTQPPRTTYESSELWMALWGLVGLEPKSSRRNKQ
jgi:hypothetical protein